jgi:DNA-binding PadR family transcriptional regulator
MVTRGRANPLALAVLSCLAERPMHPYEIATTLRERGKDSSIKINYGSLYTVVESLLRRGLIAERETVREGRRPERTVYTLTPAGRAEHDDWLSEMISRPAPEFTQFEAALSLMGGLPPSEVVPLLEQRRNALVIEVNAEQATYDLCREQGLPELFVVELEYRIALRKAELAYVEDLISRIRERKLDGVDIWESLHSMLASGDAESVAEAAARLGIDLASPGSSAPSGKPPDIRKGEPPPDDT